MTGEFIRVFKNNASTLATYIEEEQNCCYNEIAPWKSRESPGADRSLCKHWVHHEGSVRDNDPGGADAAKSPRWREGRFLHLPLPC